MKELRLRVEESAVELKLEDIKRVINGLHFCDAVFQAATLDLLYSVRDRLNLVSFRIEDGTYVVWRER